MSRWSELDRYVYRAIMREMLPYTIGCGLLIMLIVIAGLVAWASQ